MQEARSSARGSLAVSLRGLEGRSVTAVATRRLRDSLFEREGSLTILESWQRSRGKDVFFLLCAGRRAGGSCYSGVWRRHHRHSEEPGPCGAVCGQAGAPGGALGSRRGRRRKESMDARRLLPGHALNTLMAGLRTPPPQRPGLSPGPRCVQGTPRRQESDTVPVASHIGQVACPRT